MIRRLLIPTLLAVAATAMAEEPKNEAPWYRVPRLAVTLENAIHRAEPARVGPIVLDIPLPGTDAAPRGWAYAPGYNRADHPVVVTYRKNAEGHWTLKADVIVKPDGWIAGGHASYQIDLVPGPSETWQGTYTAGGPSGAATPVRRAYALTPNFVPPAAGEHPRLLFRKADLPRLRAQAETPEGKKLLTEFQKTLDRGQIGYSWAAMSKGGAPEGSHALWAVGHGLLYQLHGDKAEAQAAQDLVDKALVGLSAQDETWLYNQYIEGIAVTYDLCCEAWPEDFRLKVADWLHRVSYLLTHTPRDWRPQDMTVANRDLNPYGPEQAMFRATAGTAAMAILGDPVTFPFTTEADKATLSSPEPRWEPRKGLILPPPGEFPNPKPQVAAPLPAGTAAEPTVKFASDTVITDWIFASVPEDPKWRPFQPTNADPLESLGGSAKAHPAPGTTFKYLDHQGVFKPVDKDQIVADSYTDERPAINLQREEHFAHQTLDSYYTVIDNDRPRFVKLHLGQRWQWWPTIWIGGQSVREGQIVKLEAGKIPVLIQARVALQQNYNPYFPAMYGRLDRAGKIGQKGRRPGAWHYHWACLSDAPIQPIPKADIFMQPRLVEVPDPEPIWQAAHAQWEKTGHASPWAQETAEIALRSVQRYIDSALGDHAWNPGNSDHDEALEYLLTYAHHARNALGIDIATDNKLDWALPLAMMDGETLWRNDRGSARVWYAAGFDSIRPEFRPAFAAFFARHGYNFSMGHHGAYAFVNAPWTVEPKDPDTIFPRTLVDRQMGGFLFRSGYADGSPFATLDAALTPPRKAPLAGEFSIHGLGRDWIGRTYFGGGTAYFPRLGQPNTVTMDGLFPVGGGRIISQQLEKDGSGQVALDLAQSFYAATPKELVNLGGAGTGATFAPGEPKNAGIEATRTFLADYSRKSGAEALFVVLDRFTPTGDREKRWHANLPWGVTADDAPSTKGAFPIPGNRLTLVPSGTRPAAAGDKASLVLTFITPADPAISMTPSGRPGDTGSLTATTRADTILVVLTLQRGEPPKVAGKIDQGRATITAGSQTITLNP